MSITSMKLWMRNATAAEQQHLADAVGTTRAYLYHLSAGDEQDYKREPKPKLAAAIERETVAMAKKSGGRLLPVYRTDLVTACRECEFAQKCLGPKAVAGDFQVIEQK